jgi:hypothetical protein
MNTAAPRVTPHVPVRREALRGRPGAECLTPLPPGWRPPAGAELSVPGPGAHRAERECWERFFAPTDAMYPLRGRCPACGGWLVGRTFYVPPGTGRAGPGYVVEWACWASVGGGRSCDYRRIL